MWRYYQKEVRDFERTSMGIITIKMGKEARVMGCQTREKRKVRNNEEGVIQ